MKKTLVPSALLASAVAIGLFVSQANAATITSPAGLNNDFGATPSTFDAGDCTPACSPAGNNATPTGAFTTLNGGAYSGFGQVQFGNQANQYASPATDLTNYMAVVPNLGAGSPETVVLPGLFSSFGLFWGSIDDYNQITFFNGVTQIATFSGFDVAAALGTTASGNQVTALNNRYVEFGGLGFFNRVEFGSSQNSFEFDNVAWAGQSREINPTPLPGALPLFVSALGGIGGLLGWRKKRKAAKA